SRTILVAAEPSRLVEDVEHFLLGVEGDHPPLGPTLVATGTVRRPMPAPTSSTRMPGARSRLSAIFAVCRRTRGLWSIRARAAGNGSGLRRSWRTERPIATTAP